MELKKDRTFSLWLSLINQIAAILVVVLHQYNVKGIDFPSNTVITFISHGICTAAVPTFFFLSGYLFWNDACDWKSIKSKLKRRIFTILLPFIIWNSIYALFFILCGNLWTEINLSEIISSVFLYKYYFPMWFLFQLMIYFALSPLLFLLLKLVNVNTLVIATVVILSVVSLFFRNSISFEYNGIERTIIQFNFLIYFLFGLWLSKQKVIISKITLPNLWILIILFFIFSIFSSLLYDGYIDIFYKRLFVPLVFLSFMLMMLKIAQIWHSRNTFSLLGGVAPISLYFIHGLSGILLINICEYIGWQNSLFRYFFLCIGSISLSILCAKLLKKVFPKVYKILCGNR